MKSMDDELICCAAEVLDRVAFRGVGISGSLQLRPKALEQIFWRHRNRRLFILDLLIWQYAVSSFWARFISNFQPFRDHVLLIAVIHLQGVVLLLANAFYVNIRPRFVTLWGICKAISFSFVTCSISTAQQDAIGSGHAARALLLLSAPLQLMLCALGSVQTLPCCLLAQALYTLGTCLTCTGHIVSLLSTSAHRSAALQAYSYLDAAFMLTSGAMQPLADRPCLLHTSQLHTLVVFLQLYLGLLLPMYLLYCWELRSKVALLLAACSQDEAMCERIAAELASPAALLVRESSARAAGTHLLLHVVLLMPLCWAAAGLAPHGWFRRSAQYEAVSMHVC